MRLRKVVNRIYHGTVYYRWVLSIPPRRVRELGWAEGQELEAVAHGSTLSVRPAAHAPRSAPHRRAAALKEALRGRNGARR